MESSMRKVACLIGAGALATTLQLSAATPSQANPAVIAAAIGLGLLGLGVGAAVATSYNRGFYRTGGSYTVGDPDPGYYSVGHVNACAQAYRSYNPQTDTYLGFDGLRHQCVL
jgi:hypothetical protein